MENIVKVTNIWSQTLFVCHPVGVANHKLFICGSSQQGVYDLHPLLVHTAPSLHMPGSETCGWFSLFFSQFPTEPPRCLLHQIAADPRRVMSHPRERGNGSAGEWAATDALPLGWVLNMYVNTHPAIRVWKHSVEGHEPPAVELLFSLVDLSWEPKGARTLSWRLSLYLQSQREATVHVAGPRTYTWTNLPLLILQVQARHKPPGFTEYKARPTAFK